MLESTLDGRFREFTADAVLRNGPETDLCLSRLQGERVRFQVKGDGRLLAEAVVSWKEPVLPLKADLRKVRKLVLEVQPDGGPAWLHAGAAWLRPQLTR